MTLLPVSTSAAAKCPAVGGSPATVTFTPTRVRSEMVASVALRKKPVLTLVA